MSARGACTCEAPPCSCGGLPFQLVSEIDDPLEGERVPDVQRFTSRVLSNTARDSELGPLLQRYEVLVIAVDGWIKPRIRGSSFALRPGERDVVLVAADLLIQSLESLLRTSSEAQRAAISGDLMRALLRVKVRR